MYYSNGSNAKTQVDSWYKTNIEDKGYDSYVVTEMFAHPSNDIEVSFMAYAMEINTIFSVGLTKDPLSVDMFDNIWVDTLKSKGWHEVRFCTDASYFGSEENSALFFSLPKASKGTLFIDNIEVINLDN